MVPSDSVLELVGADTDPILRWLSFLEGEDVSEQPSCLRKVASLALKTSTGALKVVSPAVLAQNPQPSASIECLEGAVFIGMLGLYTSLIAAPWQKFWTKACRVLSILFIPYRAVVPTLSLRLRRWTLVVELAWLTWTMERASPSTRSIIT